MATDTNEPAYRLAQAAFDSIRGDLNAIDRAFAELKPDTKTLTQAYILSLTTPPFNGTEATRLILNTLQYQVAEKAAARLERLTNVLVVLTVVLVVFGVTDIFMRLCE